MMAASSSPVSPAFDAERLIALGRVTAVVPAPDGTWAAVAVARLDADGAKLVGDLWRVPLEGGAPVQLTRGPSDDRAPAFRRDGALGFLSNRNPREGKAEEGDDERAQVWLLPAEGGEAVPLTDEPLGVLAFRFGADRLLLTAEVLPGVPHAEQRARAADLKKNGPSALRFTRQPVRVWDHWLGLAAPHLIAYDECGGNRRDLTPDADREHREAEWDVSPDGRAAVITVARPGEDRLDDRALLRIDLETGAGTVLGAAPRTNYHKPLFSPEGDRIAAMWSVRSAEAVGKPGLRLFEAGDPAGRDLAPEWDRWPHLHAWTADGRALLVTADDRGSVPVFTVEAASGAVTRISREAYGGTHEGLAVVPGRAVAVGTRSRTLHAPEPFRIALAPGAEPELLAALSGFTEADGLEIATWESVSVPSDDGAPVQYFVLRPARHRAEDAPLPALLWIHGGPIGQWSEGWHGRWNPLVAVARGYVVALPNPRGSTGCGQAFVEGIWSNDWGGQCYRDLMAVTDALERLPYVDAGRIAAMGGSFGGYMTNWIGGTTDRFQALVTHASLFHLEMFHGTTDFPPWFAYHIGGAPYENRNAYDRFSPHRNVSRWKTPALVIHGEKDYRVPIGEGVALFEALQHHGVESELLVFPDENHWILKPRNAVAWYNAVLEFLDRHLRPQAPAR
jgi:dipeptidyl aminopeptidase/acylaminoacyl peptidase